MFKLFKNLLPAESTSNSDSITAKLALNYHAAKAEAITNSNYNGSQSWETQITHADTLWEQGKLSEALAIYGLAIEKNPKTLEIQTRLAERLKQQGDLATAYEKLATGLKNQGNIEQAANYYRQAINIKALTGNTKEQLLRSSISQTRRKPIPFANLKEAAFSFQPLIDTNSALLKVPSERLSFSDADSRTSVSPGFPTRLKAINPEQAKEIDWETAQVYIQKALDHLEQQEWEQSALACKQATKILPNMAEAYKIWGNALQRMGKTAEAMSCYARAVEIKPNLAEVYAGIADIYAQQGKLQQAIKHYQKAIIIRPSALVYRNLADLWQQLGDEDQSQLNIYKALELESSPKQFKTIASLNSDIGLPPKSISSVEAYCRAARQLEQKNQWKQAAIYYRKALDVSMAIPALPAPEETQTQSKSNSTRSQLNPLNNNNHLDSAKLKSSNSQLDKAIQRYLKQSKLQPNSAKIHTDLGNLYARKAKWQYAIACYRKAIGINPRFAKAHLNLARTLLRLGKQQEFIKQMQIALSIKPKIGSALDRFYLGNALVNQGETQQAIGFYYKAIVLNPKFVQAYHRMAEVLGKQGKHQQAIEFLQQGVYHNPEDAESHFFLAQQFESLQNWDSAVKTYSKVLQLESQFPGATQKLNHALAEKLKQNHRSKSK